MSVTPINEGHLATAELHVNSAVNWLEGLGYRAPSAQVRNTLRLLHLQRLSGGSARLVLTLGEHLDVQLSTGT